MKAIRVEEHGDESVLEVDDVPRPDPSTDEIQVEIESIGVNYADIDQRAGHYRVGPEPPYVPGLEAAGVVTEVGSDVEEFSVGDEVFGCTTAGTYAEYTTIPARAAKPVPSSVSTTEAGGLMIQGVTAHNALVEWGGLDADDVVLINAAAGGVGTMAVQIASERGATVVGTASTDEKLETASELGVDHPIDYTEPDVVERVRSAVPGGSVDLVLDGVGGSAFKNGLDLLRQGGTLVTYGSASGSISTVAAPRLFYRNLSVRGYHLQEALRELPDRVEAGVEGLYSMVQEGEVRPVLGDVYEIADVREVHRKMASRETIGRPVLTPEF